jgi:diacylglycerol O-acyltransferase
MKQLGILDAAFINLEQPNTPQHIGGLGIYDPSTAPEGFVRFKQVIAHLEQRLESHPLFRTRLVRVPGEIDRPYWVKDANFDVEFHLRHISLPQPGDWRQLCIQVARLHSRPLDMSRPLWEAYIIEGLDRFEQLPRGCFAVYTKMHHALVDGAGGNNFLALLHDLQPESKAVDDKADLPRLVDGTPSPSELLSRAAVNSVKNSVGLARGTVRNTLQLGRYAADVARKRIPAPDLSAPQSLLNEPVGPHRVFEAAAFPQDDFKAIQRATGSTLNDVALTVISGALCRYLKQRDALPEGSLAASLPLNMRTRRRETDDNNQVGAIFASLHTDIEDPLQRLAAIAQSTAEAKASGEASPMVDVLKLAGVVSPLIARSAARLWSRNQLSRFVPTNVSTVVSNVAGPPFPLYCAGARLMDYYGLGVLTPGVGLFNLVFSYAGQVTLSILSHRDIMPDPENYRAALEASYEELHTAALGKQRAGGRKRRGGKKTAATKPKRRAAPRGTTRKSAAASRRKKAGEAAPKSSKAPRKRATGGGTARAKAAGKAPAGASREARR